MKIDGLRILVDYERGRTIPDWRPRRFGGGKGDTRKSREADKKVEEIIRKAEEDELVELEVEDEVAKVGEMAGKLVKSTSKANGDKEEKKEEKPRKPERSRSKERRRHSKDSGRDKDRKKKEKHRSKRDERFCLIKERVESRIEEKKGVVDIKNPQEGAKIGNPVRSLARDPNNPRLNHPYFDLSRVNLAVFRFIIKKSGNSISLHRCFMYIT